MSEKLRQLEDTLNQLEVTKNADSIVRLSVMNELAWELCDIDIQRSYLLTTRIQSLLTTAPHPEEAVKCSATLARILARRGNYREALPVANKALHMAEEQSYRHLMPPILATLGLILGQMGNHTGAMAHHQREYTIAQQLGNREREAYALNNMALTHFYAKEQTLARNKGEVALAIFEEMQNIEGKALCLSNMALTLYQGKQHEEALQIGQEALRLSYACGKQGFALFTLEALGLIQIELENYTKAVNSFQQALVLADKLDARPYKATAWLHLGRVHMLMQNESAARTYLQQALQLMNETGQQKELYECHRLLSESFERKGEFAQALKHYKAYHAAQSKVSTEDSKQTLENLQILHEMQTLKAEAEIHRLKTVELQNALDRVKQLSGLLPICASCKKIRDDSGYWQQVEIYIHNHSEAKFSHSMCPDCITQYYPNRPKSL